MTHVTQQFSAAPADDQEDMAAVWSTAQVHPRDRPSYWVDKICAMCQLDCEPQRGIPLFGNAAVSDLGGALQIGTIASTAQSLIRSARQIARSEDSAFHLVVMTAGRSVVTQNGREAILEVGDFIALDRTRPYQIVAMSEFSQTVLMIPRESLSHRIGPPEWFGGAKVDGKVGFGSLLSPMLQNLGRASGIPASMRVRVAENVLDLVATALLSEDTPGPARLTLVRAKFWIETRLAGDLSGERIAAECGVTVRHLNRLFACEGTSLMEYVWNRRLDRCRRDINDAGTHHRSITDIALGAGFKDLSHFSRAYRTRYGLTARENRANRILEEQASRIARPA